MTPWDAADPPAWPGMTLTGWLRVVRRGVPMALVVFGGLAVLLLVRLVERPLYGMHRPITPRITVAVCRTALWIMGLRVHKRGEILTGPGALVANHASWLDIFVLNAFKTVYFVSKAEVAGWPGIGGLARATGTVFINRNRAEAKAQTDLFEARLLAQHRLLFFPEGTSTDGRRVLPFKSTLFAAFFTNALRHDLRLQAVTVVYHAPPDADPRAYGWWGDMDFGPHLLRMLAVERHGTVDLIYHPPLDVDAFPNRKSLARALEDQTRDGLRQRLT